MIKNIILNSDSYKYSMPNQYPPGTTHVYSYVESRGGIWDRTVVFGLQAFIKEYLTTPITKEMIDEAEEMITAHGEPFYREGWDYILNEHKGYLPVAIKAVPEGTVVPNKNVIATIVNTDPECWWLTTFLETALLRAIWYPTTVATNSYEMKQIILRYLKETSDDPQGQIGFKLHDFGARGASSQETAMIGGLAHLVNFMGTDTVSALVAAKRWYGATMPPAFSIPAAEHSTMTAWGREHEVDAYRNMLRLFAKPGTLVAVVSDSYDLWNAVDNIWGVELRQHVIDSGAVVVVRPDSGDPETVPVETVRRLGEKFGYTINSKGYKVLNNVRVIQGDGITVDTIPVILENLKAAGYAADNLSMGMGAGLLQKVDRDTLRFAMKCSAICVNGEWRDVFKDPATDPGKRSKRGQLALINEGGWKTVEADGNHWRDEMVTVFRNGQLLREWTFDEIRARAAR